ncbi:MAG TPA: hypothetical protein VHN55_01385, partial [Sphingomicrobium sp.]|nr:hypothetical protein [Sphingomicrobium sp.]
MRRDSPGARAIAGKGIMDMSSFIKILAASAFVAAASPSFAQATRTWVSGVGDDANPCSRTAPCKTFAGAISKTASNGEINCLDPGGFGAVTITKSITIDCTGTLGSILNSGVNGVIVNDGSTGAPNTIEVMLRGLTIDGGGSLGGLNGIRFLSGRSLVVEDLFIQNQTGGSGISLQPGGTAEFYAENVTVTDGATGILVQPTGATGTIRAVLRNVRSQNNSGVGLRLDTTGNTASNGIVVLADKSSFSGNGDGIIVNSPGAGTQAQAMITDSNIFA